MKSAVLCNSSINGGGEQSAQWIADKLGADLVSLSTNEWRGCKAKKQVWYMNNSIYKLLEDKDDFRKVLGYADEIYIILNFVLGGFERQRWAEEYPIKKIIFLNRGKLGEFRDKCVAELKRIPLVSLPPAVDIDKYLRIDREYDREIVLGRHSRISLKYPDDPVSIYEKLYDLPVRFAFMVAHPKIVERFRGDDRFRFHGFNEMPVCEFLSGIDIYFSLINPKTKDQGPRVLIEAMASGLPCVVENRDGMQERMIHNKTGFLVDNEDEAVEAVCKLVYDRHLRVSLGVGARERAKMFRPEKWVEVLNG